MSLAGSQLPGRAPPLGALPGCRRHHHTAAGCISALLLDALIRGFNHFRIATYANTHKTDAARRSATPYGKNAHFGVCSCRAQCIGGAILSRQQINYETARGCAASLLRTQSRDACAATHAVAFRSAYFAGQDPGMSVNFQRAGRGSNPAIDFASVGRQLSVRMGVGHGRAAADVMAWPPGAGPLPPPGKAGVRQPLTTTNRQEQPLRTTTNRH
jgi:hypothetical protein